MQKKALQAGVRRAFHLRDRGPLESKRGWDSLLRPCLSCADAGSLKLVSDLLELGLG